MLGGGERKFGKASPGGLCTGIGLAARTGGHGSQASRRTAVCVTFTVTNSRPVVQRGPVFRKARRPAGAQGKERAGTQTQSDLSWKQPLGRHRALGCPATSGAPRSSAAWLLPTGCHQVIGAELKAPSEPGPEGAREPGKGGGGSWADPVTRLRRGATANRDTQPRMDTATGPFFPRRGWPSWALKDGRGQRDTGRKMDSSDRRGLQGRLTGPLGACRATRRLRGDKPTQTGRRAEKMRSLNLNQIMKVGICAEPGKPHRTAH